MLDHIASETAAKSLAIERLTHRYGAATAVADVSLDVNGGELVALLGPSGCGKTTLLRAVGGFLAQSEGRILVGGEAVDHLPPNRRSVGIVFQNYALFPHMTAAENVAYGLDARGVRSFVRKARVEEMLGLVKLQSFAGRYPREMSGGQQQRVALARALAVGPSVLLLDEPFAALDKNLRLDMQIEIKRIQRVAQTTTLIVTHDQEEALSMADRVAVFNQGRLEQYATPSEIYDAPASLFVNTFVGAANVLSGSILSIEGATAKIATANGSQLIGRLMQDGLTVGDRVAVCIRPEQLRRGDTGLSGLVEMSLPLGAAVVHEVRLSDGSSLKVTEPREPGTTPMGAGAAVTLAPSSTSAVNIFHQH